MKHLLSSFLLLLALLLPVTAFAHDFEVDGIYYNINGTNATVTYKGTNHYSYSNEYSGSVTIPAAVTYNGTTYSVTSIGNYAFEDCSGLTSVTIPNSVTTIGSYAFYGCSGLTSVTIGNSVTTIGDYAFRYCSSLTSVTIPNSVTTFGDLLFESCSSLTSITVANGNTEYDSRNNCNAIIETASNTLIVGCKNTTIPNSVTSIGFDAFTGCSGLTSITIPNSVTSIGFAAFSGCSGLTSITIPNSVITIGNYAFHNCSGLTSITIPNSVITIGEFAFYRCSGLTSVTIGNSVTSIGDQAFYGTAWYNNQPDGLVYAGLVAYKYKGAMPDGSNIILREGSLGIARKAFEDCRGLTSVTIPNSVITIGSNAFSGCSGLTSITIGNSVTSIGDYAFYGTAWYNNQPDGLVYAGLVAYKYKGTMPDGSNIILREGSLGIAGRAFEGCSGLTSITIPNSVITIGNYAFSNCRGLTSITIPNSVITIGNYAFSNCSGLTSITVENGNQKYDSRNNCNAIIETASNTLLAGCQNTIIPNSVTSIGSSAFSSRSGLTSITIPNSVTSIGESAFSGCSGLTSITIPNSVTSISSNAFYGCRGLTSVTIPNSVTSIGDQAFYDCSGLEDMYISISDPSSLSLGYDVFRFLIWYYIEEDDWYYSEDGDYSNRTLHVPIGSLKAYKSDNNWYPYFGQIVEMEPVLAISIELDKSTAVVIEGETLQLMATILPVNAVKTINWSSSNPEVATVDDDGLVAAHSVGTATITAMTTDGSNLSASCVVTVKSLSSTECLSMPDGEVLHGETITIPVRMNNEATVLAFQTDIYLPEGFTLASDGDDEPMVMPADRLTSDHLIMTETVSSGAVRVVCYTPMMEPISANEGDLFYITVNVPDDAAGDYAIYLRNSRLTIDDFSEVRIPDAGAVLTVKTFIPGDVNDTHTVNVADIVTTVRYVLEQNPTPFIFDAADMNGDGEVTVTDIMLIARLIMYPTMNAPRHAPSMLANSDRMSGEDIALTAGEMRTVNIALDNEVKYSAFQLDLHLPEGLTATNFSLTDRAANHALEVNTLTNGTIRALCYTPTTEAIDGNRGTVLTFDVTATAPVNGDITVDGIELVTTSFQTVKPAAFTIGVTTATAVNELQTGKAISKVEYFNLAGQRLTRPVSGVTLIVTTYTDGTRTTTKLLH